MIKADLENDLIAQPHKLQSNHKKVDKFIKFNGVGQIQHSLADSIFVIRCEHFDGRHTSDANQYK